MTYISQLINKKKTYYSTTFAKHLKSSCSLHVMWKINRMQTKPITQHFVFPAYYSTFGNYLNLVINLKVVILSSFSTCPTCYWINILVTIETHITHCQHVQTCYWINILVTMETNINLLLNIWKYLICLWNLKCLYHHHFNMSKHDTS